jgi:hypothetical protein
MATFLGLLELVAWIVAVVSLAAAVTYAVIRIFPSRDEKPASTDAAGS